MTCLLESPVNCKSLNCSGEKHESNICQYNGTNRYIQFSHTDVRMYIKISVKITVKFSRNRAPHRGSCNDIVDAASNERLFKFVSSKTENSFLKVE